MRVDELKNHYGIPTSCIHGPHLSPVKTLNPYQPYLITDVPTHSDRCLLNNLGTPGNVNNIAKFCEIIGPENAMAFVEVHQKLCKAKVNEKTPAEHAEHKEAQKGKSISDTILSTTEISVSTLHKRSDKFVEAAEKYKEAILKWKNAIRSKNKVRISAAEHEAKKLFDELQRHYHMEIKHLKSK